MRSLTFLVFVFLTFCCWGVYGPVLHIGQAEMSGVPGKLSSLRPFICVGIAYFLIAVAFPLIVLVIKGEKGAWNLSGFALSFFAGAVGAIGALGIILAFKFQGKPFYVMPLVFGLAPIVNTLVTMLMAKTFNQASAVFYLAILVVALGAAGVLVYKPAKQAAVAHAGVHISPENVVASPAAEKTEPKPFLIGLSIVVTALCWGAYGPLLHKGQSRMLGSRLRPFVCVGLAYFAIAVIVPLILLPYFQEPGSFDNTSGVGWSLLAGAAGAVGALGIIYAFNFGGKPIFIMPLVFGLAPVVNTLIETFHKGLFEQITPQFLISLALVITGAVMVLVFAPRPKPPVKPVVEVA